LVIDSTGTVGIGTTFPASSAKLEVNSTTKGFLPPRMTGEQRDAISNPAAGLMVFDESTNCMRYYNGTVWSECIGRFGAFFTDHRNGKDYSTVQIGTQCWMAENLNYDQNTFGDDWCYDNNSSNCDTYGRLYNWAAVMQGASSSNANPSGVQGVCPDGWHMPSHAEWTELTDYLGGLSVAGGKMKETGTTHWLSPNTGATNSSEFTGLPGGFRNYTGGFNNFSAGGYWWSSTETSGAWRSSLYYNVGTVSWSNMNKQFGYSVRCLRD
ncbi:MAG: hypothetical protein GY727_00515, partial [Gammaproteobacteria bacterium]|nr:hypothetical protein [Gammaproteobacteria bacterium]